MLEVVQVHYQTKTGIIFQPTLMASYFLAALKF